MTKVTLTNGSGITITGTNVLEAAYAKAGMTGWARGEYSADVVDITGGGHSRIMAVRFVLDLPGRLVQGVQNRKAFINWSPNQAVVTATGAIGPAGPVGLTGSQGIQGEPGLDGADGANGADGTDGDNGWTPELAVVTDGTRRVQQVVDWFGGEGTKPTTGDYVGATGLTPTIGDAIDIRGPEGTATIPDGDKGDITTSDDGDTWTLNNDVLRDVHFPSDAVNLPAIRKRLRNIPDLGDYGITSSGSTDYGQSDFDSVVSGLVADGHRLVLAPAGNYRLGEQIQFSKGPVLEGEHKSFSVFKMHHANTGFVFTGADENGGGLRNLSVVNDSGTTCVAYVQLIAAIGGTSPDFFFIDECNFTGFSAATSAYGLIFDGNARDGTAPNGLKGVRNLFVRNTQVFNCNVVSVELRQARGVRLDGLEIYQADGAVQKLSITGSNATKPSSLIRMIGCVLGDVSVDYANDIKGRDNTMVNVTVTANASTGTLGLASSSVVNNGTNFVVEGLV
ncbi:collagen-like protein [Bosea sp. Root670]|uniref:collagen-like triple helix repeat-containing protein n=1 Tax=Bosea sp. Root670 TaxID=1736583 RepID=UPI0012E38293|nr:collagen-like protein [Bosea sp. Root670]